MIIHPDSVTPLSTLTTSSTPKKAREKVINKEAQQSLPPPSIASEPSGWRSWLPWGQKKDQPIEEAVQEKNDSQSEMASGKEELSEQAKNGNFGVAVTKTEQLGKSWVDRLGEKATVGWQTLKGVATTVMSQAVTTGVQACASHYSSTLDKTKLIAESKQKMLEHAHDSQFIEFYDLIRALVVPMVKDEIENYGKAKDDNVLAAQNLHEQKKLVIDLVEINLAKGFANLAEDLNHHKDQIVDYDKHPFLVNLISFCTPKVMAHLDPKRLAEIEEKYRVERTEVPILIKKMIPNIETDPDKQALIKAYIEIHASHQDEKVPFEVKNGEKASIYLKRVKILNKLLGTHFGKDHFITQGPADIQVFYDKLNTWSDRHAELKQIFDLVADDILVLLFPHKLADVELPSFLKWMGGGEYIYNKFLKHIFVEFLQETYEPLEYDVKHNENLKEELQAKLGISDLTNVTQSFAVCISAFGKKFIGADPNAVKLTGLALDEILHAPILSQVEKKNLKKDLVTILRSEKIAPLSLGLTLEEIRKLSIGQRVRLHKLLKDQVLSLKPLSASELKKRIAQEIIFPQLSQEQLANWIIESIQTLLHTQTQNPDLLSVSHFTQQLINRLTLSLLVKGAKLAIPDGEKIDENQFLKELLNRMTAKIGSLQGQEAIPESFWKDFLQDMPLPPFVKELLVPRLTKKAKKLQKELKQTVPDLQEIEETYAKLKSKIQTYANGKDIFLITEKVSDQLVEKILEKNIGLVATFDVGDTVEELLAQYLPDVKIDKNLIIWFKENVTALGTVDAGQSSHSMTLLKQGIQIILCKSLINVIETDFKNDSQDYAFQLKKNIQQAFAKSLANFEKKTQRKEFDKALAIQKNISKNLERIEELKNQEIPDLAITSYQLTLIKEMQVAHTRYTRSSDYFHRLTERRKDILAKLNWEAIQLSYVGQALILHKMDSSQKLNELKEKIKKLQKDTEQGVDVSKELAIHKILFSLLQMSPEQLQLVSEVVNIEATLQHAQKEQAYLKQELEGKERAISQQDLEVLDNRAEWDKAKQWLNKACTSRQKIHELFQEVEDLEKELDSYLLLFQNLAQELTKLIGLDQSQLKLPPLIKDQIWPLLETAKKEYLARFLFQQIAPILLPILDIQNNKAELTRLSKGNPFIGQLVQTVSDELLKEIKTTILTSDQIKEALHEIIPEATELQALLIPQLQYLLAGEDAGIKLSDDPTFIASQEFIQRYVEGMAIKAFVKIAESNKEEDQDILVVLTQKLQQLSLDVTKMQGKNPEEAAHQMIDQVLKEVGGISSQKDLEGIPLFLQKKAYTKLKEKIYEKLTPLVLPIVERVHNRARLHELTSTHFLEELSQALAKDVFYLLPASINSYRAIAQELLMLLSGTQPTADQVEKFAQKIETLVKQANQKDITHEDLLQAYIQVAKVKLNSATQVELTSKLDAHQSKEKIKDVLMTPEELAALVGIGSPQAMASELQKLIHENPEVYQNAANFAESYVEGMLLRVFIRIAEANPAKGGKDTIIVITEKLLDLVTKKYADIKSRPFKEVVQELNDAIMKDILQIDSPAAFEGLPDAIKEIAYKLVKDQVAGWLLSIQQSLLVFDSSNTEVIRAKEEVKKFGIAKDATQSYAQILSNDIAAMVMDTVPAHLTKIGGEKMWGINLVSKSLESHLKKLGRKHFEVAKVLLEYTKSDRFQDILENNLKVVADPKQFVEDKQQVTDLLSNLILVPLNKMLAKASDVEVKHRSENTQKLMAALLNLAADHLKTLNEAKKLASHEGRKDIHYKDFVSAAGTDIHPGVLLHSVNYQKSIDLIADRLYHRLGKEQQKSSGKTFGKLNQDQEVKWLQGKVSLRIAISKLVREEKKNHQVLSLKDVIAEIERIHEQVTGTPLTKKQKKALRAPDEKDMTLKDLIRQEASDPKRQRDREAYKPTTRFILNMIYPRGKQDLVFVPEELRERTWDICENHLFPHVLRILTELMLKPDVINQLVLNGLREARDSFKKDIVLIPDEPADKALDELDKASGRLLAETLNVVDLPGWIRDFMVNPKTGKIYPKMEKLLGASLRRQFDDTFIRDKMQDLLRIMVHRDEKGDHLIKHYTFDSKEEKLKEIKIKREETQAKIKQVSRELINVSISHFFRYHWTRAQAHFDQFIEKTLGHIGTKMKKALDAVFAFIFFKIVGSVLSYLLLPVELLAKEIIYEMINLDKNRNAVLNLLTKTPMDQPLSSKHMVYHEDLIFKAGHMLKEALGDILNEPMLPMSKENAISNETQTVATAIGA